MSAPIYMACSRCGRLAYCQNGVCDACASYLAASGYSSYGPARPKCSYCGGTGKVTHMFGPDTPCPHCGGTGKL